LPQEKTQKLLLLLLLKTQALVLSWAGPMAGLIMEKYLKDTLSAIRWKEVERIENQEIILPIVKAKRNRLDSLKRERLKKQQLRVLANHEHDRKDNNRKKAVAHHNIIAIKPNDEEQFV